MRALRNILMVFWCVGFAMGAQASGEHAGHGTQAAKPEKISAVKLVLTPAKSLVKDEAVEVTATLATADGKPITEAMLKRVHTQKFHLLVVDPSLTDYHHIHPVKGDKPGEYHFSFTPKTDHGYRAWADVTLAKTGVQAYVPADMGVVEAAEITKKIVLESEREGYRFVMTLDSSLQVGSATMATVAVTKDGKPFAGLAPVMGAFAHMVGFNEDYHTIMHIHPMGEEPTTDAARGGPELMFHIEPAKAGFVKLFAQFKIDGRDVFVPFGVMVKP